MEQRDYSLPDSAKKALEKVYDSLEKEFYLVWSILLPGNERDEVIFHLLEAKRKLYRILMKEDDSK